MDTLNHTGISVSKPVAGSGGFTFFVQAKPASGFPPYWGGNFSPLDNLLNTSLNDPGPIKISFKQPVSGAGAQIETNGGGTFTARITSFDNNGLQLSSFTEKGVATGAKDGSAIFLGILDDTKEISALQFSIDIFPASGPGQFTDFTINQLSIATQPALIGDYSNNGLVDAADYVMWRDNNGTANTLPNDPIGGTIGAAQFDQWRAHFGQFAGTGSMGSHIVPEPPTLLMWVSLLASWCIRRARTT